MKWWELARTQSGVVTHDQLVLAGGYAAGAITRMIADERVDSVGHGLYLVRGAPFTYRARLWAAVLATGGVLGYATAAELWGVSDVRAESIHVVVPHGRRLYPPPWIRLHRQPLPPNQSVVRDELPMTARSWTVLDHAPTLGVSEAIRLADRALQRQWITTADIASRLDQFPGRHGNRVLRRLAAVGSDGAAAESERRFHRLLRSAGIRDWTPNYPVWSNGELVGVVDVALPGRRIAIEIDGMAYHVDVDRFRGDRSRQNHLVALGWTVLRFTWADLTERPGYVIATIRRLAA